MLKRGDTYDPAKIYADNGCWGIDVNKLGIVIGKLRGWPGAHGVYKKDEQWIYFSADDRNHIDQDIMANEDEAFEVLLNAIDSDLSSFTNKFVTKNVAKLSKRDVITYLRQKCSLSDERAQSSWNYLKQNLYVLFEFKYFVVNENFPPEKSAYKVKGYSTEQIYKTTSLTPLGAYNYLIYLRNKPEEALAKRLRP